MPQQACSHMVRKEPVLNSRLPIEAAKTGIYCTRLSCTSRGRLTALEFGIKDAVRLNTQQVEFQHTSETNPFLSLLSILNYSCLLRHVYCICELGCVTN